MISARAAKVDQPHGIIKKVERLVAPHGLMAMGGLHQSEGDAKQTIVLIGTAPAFWSHFAKSHEFVDGKPDPIDRWSERILPIVMEQASGADVVFPFGGPPYAPFLAWAKQSGEAFDSPVGMLVHYRAGLMISYRGAIVFSDHLPLPESKPENPCDSCTLRPCATACPVDALSDEHFYDVPRCKSHIGSQDGETCIVNGCASRLACPVSQEFGRSILQTEFHMRAFKGI